MKLLIIVLCVIFSVFVAFGILLYRLGKSMCAVTRCGCAGNDRGYI